MAYSAGSRQLVRSFMAVEIGDALRGALKRTVNDLKKLNTSVRWVEEKNWHMTAKFLGDIPWLDVGLIGKAMQEEAERCRPFYLDLVGLKTFPAINSGREPRVVAVGVEGGGGDPGEIEKFAELHRKLDERMLEYRVRAEHRTFTAHLTLGRIQGKQGLEQLFNQIESLKDKHFGSLEADEVVMYQSEIFRDGAEYTPLASAALGRKKTVEEEEPLEQVELQALDLGHDAEIDEDEEWKSPRKKK